MCFGGGDGWEGWSLHSSSPGVTIGVPLSLHTRVFTRVALTTDVGVANSTAFRRAGNRSLMLLGLYGVRPVGRPLGLGSLARWGGRP